MARPGYEADRQVLQVRDLATGQVRAVTANWDRSVGSIAWSKDGKSIIVNAEDVMEAPLFRVDVASGKVTRLTGDGLPACLAAGRRRSGLFTMNSVMAPDDLFRVDAKGKVAQLTNVNRDAAGRARSGQLREVQLHRRQ